ncbi:MAG: hypothetical protein CXZ00_08165 [Acidobacteria bacterium]|nr:MAG: hypothetical protein CXZ00_08165 [Acidobacteriota bacterium]
MKHSISIAVLAFFFVCPSAAQDTAPVTSVPSTLEKPRVFVRDSHSWETRAAAGGSHGSWGGTSSGGARPQTAEIIKTFGERCRGAVVNNLQDKADFIVVLDHEGGKGLLRHKNKVAVFERTSGDTIVSKSTLSLGGAVQESCEAIAKYWAQNGARLIAVKSASTVTPRLDEAPVPTSSTTNTVFAETSIASTPSGAEIEIDGSFVGNTPSSMELTAGNHVIRIAKKGFLPYEKKLRVSSGKINLSAELEPIQQ